MSQNKDKLVAAYVPVLHQGYIDFFNRHMDTPIGVFDDSITSQFDYLRKDIRTLQPELAVRALKGLGFGAYLLDADEMTQVLEDDASNLVFADDDLSHSLVATSDTKASISYEPVFLRWDRKNVNVDSDVVPDRVIPIDEVLNLITNSDELYREASRSSDWWRHVAAAVIDDGNGTILAHNRAMPHEYVNSIEGDPRITARRGEVIEKSLFIHAEADLIAHMAQGGISTKDRELFVTTFPCPNCARLIAASGFKTCYFIEGYAMLDGQRVLNDAGIEIVRISISKVVDEPAPRLRPYPKK